MSDPASVKKFKDILIKHGIKLKIGGCGCCDSPWITVEYKGKIIIDDEELFMVNMFSGDDKEYFADGEFRK